MNKLLLAFCVVAVCAAATATNAEEEETDFIRRFSFSRINKRLKAAAAQASRNARKASIATKTAPRGWGLRKNRKALRKSVKKARKGHRCGIPKRGFLQENGFFKRSNSFAGFVKRAIARQKALKAKRAAKKAAKKAVFKKTRARVIKLSKKNRKAALKLGKYFRRIRRSAKRAAAVRKARRRLCYVAFWRKVRSTRKKVKPSKKNVKAAKIAKANLARAMKKLTRSMKKLSKKGWGRKVARRRWARKSRRSARKFRHWRKFKRVGRKPRRSARKFRRWRTFKRVGRKPRRSARKPRRLAKHHVVKIRRAFRAFRPRKGWGL